MYRLLLNNFLAPCYLYLTSIVHFTHFELALNVYILYKRLMTGSSKYFYNIFIFILFRRNGHNFAYLQLLKHNNNKILYLISKYCTYMYAIISQ